MRVRRGRVKSGGHRVGSVTDLVLLLLLLLSFFVSATHVWVNAIEEPAAEEVHDEETPERRANEAHGTNQKHS